LLAECFARENQTTPAADGKWRVLVLSKHRDMDQLDQLVAAHEPPSCIRSLVVFNMHWLPPGKVQSILTRCYLARMRVLMVLRHPTRGLCAFKLAPDLNGGAPVHVRASITAARVRMGEAARALGVAPSEAWDACRALRMALGGGELQLTRESAPALAQAVQV
jgi:hypothetical protein